MRLIEHESLLEELLRLKDELSGCLIISRMGNGNYEVFDLKGPMAHAILDGLRKAEKREKGGGT
jgi:hypothetical protein